MALSNYERMMLVVEEVFATKNDPDQLNVDEQVIERLQQMHPATLSEETDENGPIAWILLIPTTKKLMQQFVNKEISENELYHHTPMGISYDALYLCSGVVLEEYRRKGISKRLTLNAINAIRQQHPLQALLVWSFTEEGDRAAEAIAQLVGLPLYKR